MGSRAVSPGGALLRSSRMFSMPKPIPDGPSTSPFLAENKSDTMTKPTPQRQSITSPLGSREKGDWGLKRPFPLKTTMATSTPVFRVKQVDAIENVTDFTSAADHTLSLEKFQEMRIPLVVPVTEDKFRENSIRRTAGLKSVFEEDMDFTVRDSSGGNDEKRWKFKGPWLAQMTEGDFNAYISSEVRPRRAQFRKLLRRKLASDITARNRAEALEKGGKAEAVRPEDITDAQFTEYVWTLRYDRAVLYSLVSKFLDLAPLGQPVGLASTGIFGLDSMKVPESPYGMAGPPPSHPSGGIGYLRTGAVMENHPVYGPQSRRTPINARIVSPRAGATPARLGMGGFVASVPTGDNNFNVQALQRRGQQVIRGIQNLDVTTYGGAKTYIEPVAAHVNSSGRVVIKTRETSAVAQLIAKEGKGEGRIYNGDGGRNASSARKDKLVDEILPEEPVRARKPEKDIVGSSRSYGLDS